MTPVEIKKVINEKVSGIWEANHDTSGHRYRNTITGHIQRSVTTKLGILSKPHLLKWSVKVGVEWLMVEDRWQRLFIPHWKDEMMTGAQLAHTGIRDTAGSIGTVAHDMAERYINEWIAGHQPEDIKTLAPNDADPRSIASARAVESWFKKHDIVPLASEILVGENKYSAGTLDFLCLLEGKLTLIDFKTSNGVDDISYSLQVAAYKYFFEQMTGLKIVDCKILHLSKDYDKFTVYKVMKLAQAYKAFKMVCGVYDWMYSKNDKIKKDIKTIKI